MCIEIQTSENAKLFSPVIKEKQRKKKEDVEKKGSKKAS